MMNPGNSEPFFSVTDDDIAANMIFNNKAESIVFVCTIVFCT